MAISDTGTETRDNFVQDFLDRYNMTHDDIIVLIAIMSVVFTASRAYLQYTEGK